MGMGSKFCIKFISARIHKASWRSAVFYHAQWRGSENCASWRGKGGAYSAVMLSRLPEELETRNLVRDIFAKGLSGANFVTLGQHFQGQMT